MPQAAARDYFYRHGRVQGICGSPLCEVHKFTEFLNTKFENKRILEQGPGHCPKMKSKNLYFFDIRDTEQLKAWAKSAGLPVENVPPLIHYISP